ncbi:MAG: apolipoprotein N-acyltransferase [Candidatus Kapaibacteriota bacterium]
MSTGILLALSYPPYPFFLLAFVAFIPILSVFRSVKRKWWLVYATFFIYHYATNWWISSWQKDTDPYLFVSGFAVALVHPLLFMLPFAIFNIFVNKIGWQRAVVLFPFVWLTFEWLHSLGDLAYPWLTVGYTQIYNHYWVQIADIAGVWLCSFLILFVNVFVFMAIEDIKLNKNTTLKAFIKNRYVIFALIIFALPYFYGLIRIQDFKYEKLIKQGEKIRVGIIQPNINPWRKWETNALSQIQIHKQIQDSLSAMIKGIDLFIWSETAITLLDLEVNAFHKFDNFYQMLNGNSSLLTGFADFRFLSPKEKPSFTTKYLFGDSTKPYDTYNSILLLNPDNSFQIYHKNRLTPFGEHIPYGEILGFAKSFLEWNVGISSWAKGKEKNVLEMKTFTKECKIAPIICIESIYPDYCRQFVQNGAELMVIITNDGWYDHTFGPLQHYLIATVRAIENRRFVARCANTGISGIITPTGQTLIKAEQYQKTGFAADVPLIDQATIYTKIGDVLPYVSFVFNLIIFIIILTNYFKSKI